MKSSPSHPAATKVSEEYTTFEAGLCRVLKVSHSEMKAKLEAEKKQKPKRAQASSRVSGEKD